MWRPLIRSCVACLMLVATLRAQQSDQELIRELTKRLADNERRIQALEQKLSMTLPESAGNLPSASQPVSTAQTLQTPSAPLPSAPSDDAAAQAATENTQAVAGANPADMQGHSMEIPGGGPTLNIRGFFDFNFGVGSVANPLVFPVVDNGCGTCGSPATPPHATFQAGEFDLLITSKLSDHLSFLSEVVLGAGVTNEFEVDIERYQLTYQANRYFSASGGRFHTSIGYYNTAYHHGNWFSTAEGRPIMYLFEDSGGVLPVHMVGVTFTGEVPHTDALGLHWVAEIGNGLSSNPNATEAVQNFYSDRNYKATNLAAYIRPRFLSGLQIGGSWYHDGINPSQAQNSLPVSEIRQNIESAYIVYFSSNWEFMNEAVLLTNHIEGTSQSFRSPMAYTQIARKFGIYKPYFRYQYVNDSMRDPINLLRGLYYGPSIGARVDFSDYAAFKLQFNHLFQSSQLAGNGLDAQIAFTF